MAKEECTEAQQSKLPVVGDFRKKSKTEKKRETFNFCGEFWGNLLRIVIHVTSCSRRIQRRTHRIDVLCKSEKAWL